MKKVLISLIICCSVMKVGAQFPNDEQPISFSTDFTQRSISSQPFIPDNLPDMQLVGEEDLLSDTIIGFKRVAVPVRVNYSLHNSGYWVDLPDGGKLWRLDVSLPGALATHAVYDEFWLPEGAKFFVYSADRKQSFGAFTYSTHSLCTEFVEKKFTKKLRL